MSKIYGVNYKKFKFRGLLFREHKSGNGVEYYSKLHQHWYSVPAINRGDLESTFKYMDFVRYFVPNSTDGGIERIAFFMEYRMDVPRYAAAMDLVVHCTLY